VEVAVFVKVGVEVAGIGTIWIESTTALSTLARPS